MSYDTKLLIVENNCPKVVEIGAWIDDYLNARDNSVIHYGPEDANMELIDISKLGMDVHISSCDNDGNVNWHKITNITRHDPSEFIYKIKTKWGREVSVVASKSLLIWNKNTKVFEEKNSEDVQIGNKVPITFNLPTKSTICVVNMRNYLSDDNYIYGTDYNKLNDEKKKTKQFEILNDHVYLKCARYNSAPLKEMFELNRENGFFIGIYLAEGNTCKDYVSIANNDPKIQEAVRNWFDKHNIAHKTQVKPFNPLRPGLSTSVRGYSTILVQFLERFLGKYSHGKYVPNEAFLAPDEFVQGLIDGYISGDGCVTDYHVVVSSVSKDLIQGISNLLARYGIFTKLSNIQQKKNNVGSKNILRRYILSVQSKYVYRFGEVFTLTEQKKQDKLTRLCSRKTLDNMSFLYEEHNDVILDEIVSITKIPASSDKSYQKVYDITVPETLNFQLFNGLQVRDTSETGYIQRRLVKAMEDAKVYYDHTVRNAAGSILQFIYGEDGMEGTKIESQRISTLDQNIFEIQQDHLLVADKDNKEALKSMKIHMTKEAYDATTKDKTWKVRCREHYEKVLDDREYIIINVFHKEHNESIFYPIPFERIIAGAFNRMKQVGLDKLPSDLTPMYIFDKIDSLVKDLYVSEPTQGTRFLKILLNVYLSPKPMIFKYHMKKEMFDWICSEVERYFKEALCPAGEMVGIIAAQSMGEPATQLSACKNTQVRIISGGDMEKKSHTGGIGEFIDALMKKYKNDVIDLGNDSTALYLPEDFYIIGVSDNEKTTWRRILEVTRHPANGGMVMVKTRSGRKTTATLSHSFLKRTKEGTIVPIEGSKLEIGDRIPVARFIPTIENPLVEMEINDRTFALDKDFGWLVGAYLADGNVASSVTISKTAPEFEEKLKQFCMKYDFSLKIRECQGGFKNDPIYKDRIYTSKSNTIGGKGSAKFGQWMNDNFKTGSYRKRIPAWVYASNKEFIAGIVSGYFDGDGNVNVEKQMIRCHSVNEGLIDDMSILLSYCGMFASKLKEGRNREISNIFHVLCISKKYAKTFEDVVGLNIGYKAEALKEIIKYNERDGAHNVQEGIDQIPECGDSIAYIGSRLELPGQSRNYKRWEKKPSVGRRTLEKYVALFKAANDLAGNLPDVVAHIKLLEQAVNANVVWDEIVELEYLPDPKEYVYDFTVPGNDSFMVDCGILVHNTLDSFHVSGTAAAVKATSGVPRLKELLSVSRNIKTPSLNISLKPDIATVFDPTEDEEGNIKDENVDQAKMRAMQVLNQLEITRLVELVDKTEIYFDPVKDDFGTDVDEDAGMMTIYKKFQDSHTQLCKSDSPWVLRIKINKAKMDAKDLSMMDIYIRIFQSYSNQIECLFSDDNADELIFRIRLNSDVMKDIEKEDAVAALKALEHNLLHNVLIKGSSGIHKVSMHTANRKLYNPLTQNFHKVTEWVLDTDGSNLQEILANPNVDAEHTFSNDVWEIYECFGIEAARTAIYNEIMSVIRESFVNYRHLSLLIDTMTHRGFLMSIDRHGINRGDVGPLAKSSFEETTDMLINASVFSDYDRINGVSANIMLGQLPPCGTGDSDILLDENKYMALLADAMKAKINQMKARGNDDEEEPKARVLAPSCEISNLMFDFKIPEKKEVGCMFGVPNIVLGA